jgi:hypothetical protein
MFSFLLAFSVPSVDDRDLLARDVPLEAGAARLGGILQDVVLWRRVLGERFGKFTSDGIWELNLNLTVQLKCEREKKTRGMNRLGVHHAEGAS